MNAKEVVIGRNNPGKVEIKFFDRLEGEKPMSKRLYWLCISMVFLLGLTGIPNSVLVYSAPGEIKVLYRCGEINQTTNAIRCNIQVLNNSTSSINLPDVKIRYWYTKDGTQAQVFTCDWAQIGAAKITGKFVSMANPASNADGCLEIGFSADAGTLAAGAGTGEIQIRINKSDWSNYNQANDYSCNTTMGSYTENPKITGYIRDILSYGSEPGNSVPTPSVTVVPTGIITPSPTIRITPTPIKTPTPVILPTATPSSTPAGRITLYSDGFESGNLTGGGWTNSGCTVTSAYKYAGTYAALFNSSDSLHKTINTNNYGNIQVQYARLTRNCETDDFFIAEWYNGSIWTTLESLPGNSAWAVKTWDLPVGAANNASFQIRFRTSHNGASDYAYLDEVRVTGINMTATPTISPDITPTPNPSASPTPVVTPTPTSGVYRPFPQHTVYSAGTIKPNHVTQSQMDNAVQNFYLLWKTRYLTRHPKIADQYYIFYNGQGYAEPANAVSCSEGHGYGMLITVLMAGFDADAKVYFDGLFRFYKAHPSSINPRLMAWQQIRDSSGNVVDTPGSVDSATDGDMDIAYALLLAGLQWGNNGAINYTNEAKSIIDAILNSEVNKTEWILKLGDWASDSDSKYGKATRPSDFMLSHLKAFQKATGNANWTNVLNQTQSIINAIYSNYSSNTGLMPDFVIKQNNVYQPAPAGFLEDNNDGNYYYNSCRTPWRFTIDYLLTGDSSIKNQLMKLNAWIQTKTGGNPGAITAGYRLDGSNIESYNDMCFTAPFAVSAMIDATNQEWLNRLWDQITVTDEPSYYGDSIKMLGLITVSGNWWAP